MKWNLPQNLSGKNWSNLHFSGEISKAKISNLQKTMKLIRGKVLDANQFKFSFFPSGVSKYA